jgi:hypothetical protein
MRTPEAAGAHAHSTSTLLHSYTLEKEKGTRGERGEPSGSKVPHLRREMRALASGC